MKTSKTLLLSTLTATLILSGCGSETTNQETLTNTNQPHKVARAYGNQELSNSTYANVTIDNSKYFFEYGSSQPHVQVYIDNDLDANTGYNMWEDDTLGAEYMLEDNRLYKYTNIGEGTWTWEYISKTGPNDINYYEVRLGFDIFGDSFAMQVAAIDKDWSRAYISDKKIITNKDNPNNDNIKLTITDDNSNIYFAIKQKDSVKHFLYYIDTDKNKQSGYSTNGAEYLVEDNRLYKYAGDGSSWEWENKGTVAFEREQGNPTTKTILPKSSIVSTDNISVKAYGLGSDWGWVNNLDAMSYEVGGEPDESRIEIVKRKASEHILLEKPSSYVISAIVTASNKIFVTWKGGNYINLALYDIDGENVSFEKHLVFKDSAFDTQFSPGDSRRGMSLSKINDKYKVIVYPSGGIRGYRGVHPTFIIDSDGSVLYNITGYKQKGNRFFLLRVGFTDIKVINIETGQKIEKTFDFQEPRGANDANNINVNINGDILTVTYYRYRGYAHGDKLLGNVKYDISDINNIKVISVSNVR